MQYWMLVDALWECPSSEVVDYQQVSYAAEALGVIEAGILRVSDSSRHARARNSICGCGR
jgi:hypothetical protein